MVFKTTSTTMTTATVLTMSKTPTHTMHRSQPATRKLATLFDAAQTWDFNSYRVYSGGVNFLSSELNRVNAATAPLYTDTFPSGAPAFTTIVDGDLDGDLIPNFLDPDNDNDGTPDSADTDDDNDGILDMSDPDDDNDGIHDVCVNIDVNGDNKGDYNGLLNGEPTTLDAATTCRRPWLCDCNERGHILPIWNRTHR